MANRINTKYAVGLAPLQNSFFDPESGCNLFRSTPVYAFNHKPTRNLKDGVKLGSLIDMVGNILSDQEVVDKAMPSSAEDKANIEEKAASKVNAKNAKAKEKADNVEASK